MINILCFGDNITAGYSNKGNTYNPYYIELKNMLGGDYNIDNMGISGIFIEDVLENLDNDKWIDYCDRHCKGLTTMLKHKKYDYCIVLLGTNDICDDFIDDVYINLEKIYDIINSFNVKIIALTVPRIVYLEKYLEVIALRDAFNKKIHQYKNIFKEQGFEVIDIANVLDSLDPNDIYDRDGVHFQKNGYRRIAEIVANHFIN